MNGLRWMPKMSPCWVPVIVVRATTLSPSVGGAAETERRLIGELLPNPNDALYGVARRLIVEPEELRQETGA